MKNLSFLGLPNHCVTKDGKVYSVKSGRFLTSHSNAKGYLRISLWDGQKLLPFTIHRLVAYAYLNLDPTSGQSSEVNHIDGNKENNCVSNLEICTTQENIAHSVSEGLRDSQKMYSDDEIHTVCKYLEDGFRNKDIVEITGVHPSKVSMIKNGLAYQYISCEYDICATKAANRISIDKIVDICDRLSKNESPRSISRNIGVSYPTVRYIKRRETHTQISKNFIW